MTFDVIITSFRMNSRESASQVLERAFGIEPERARALVRTFPATVIQGTSRAHAENAAEQLREAGAKVEIAEHVQPPPSAPSAKTAADLAGSAKTEAFGSDAIEKLAAIAKKLQEQKQGVVQPLAASAIASTAAAEVSPAAAQVSPATAQLAKDVAALDAAPPRKMFSTVAMQSIEADLQRFEVTDFGPPPPVERNDWADPITPNEKLSAKVENAQQPRLKLQAGKPGFPEVDELFAPPPAKSTTQGVTAQSGQAKGNEIDELFSPPGADHYYKGKAEVPGQGRAYPGHKDAQARPLTPRGEDKVWRPAQDKSLDQGNLTGDGGDAVKEAAGATAKTMLAKAAAGLLAMTLVAGVGLAVLNAREARALNQPRPMDPGETKAEWMRKEDTKRMHPVLRMAPSSIAPAFASILRKQIDKVFHVAVEWDDSPEDLDCMLVGRDKKFQARMTKLMRTGAKIEYPAEVEAQFDEHVETLRMAHGKPNQQFARVCLSVEFLDDSEKEPKAKKVIPELELGNDEDEEQDDQAGATIDGRGTSF